MTFIDKLIIFGGILFYFSPYIIGFGIFCALIVFVIKFFIKLVLK